MDTAECTKILKALGEDTRMRIFGLLRGGTLCACDIFDNCNITQPTLSHHMKILCDSSIVVAEKDWKWMYYSIDCKKLNELLAYLGDTKCNKKRGTCGKDVRK